MSYVELHTWANMNLQRTCDWFPDRLLGSVAVRQVLDCFCSFSLIRLLPLFFCCSDGMKRSFLCRLLSFQCGWTHARPLCLWDFSGHVADVHTVVKLKVLVWNPSCSPPPTTTRLSFHSLLPAFRDFPFSPLFGSGGPVSSNQQNLHRETEGLTRTPSSLEHVFILDRFILLLMKQKLQLKWIFVGYRLIKRIVTKVQTYVS